MAKKVIRNPYIFIGGQDRTAEINAVEFEDVARELDGTTADTGGYEETTLGLKKATIRLEIKKVAYNLIDQQLYDAYQGNGELAFVFRPSTDARGPDNPEYTGTMVVTRYTAGGAVGDIDAINATYPLAGALTRNAVA